MTRAEWIAEVQARAQALADQAGTPWPSQVRLHDRHAPGGVVLRYAVSVHGGPEPEQRTLVLWLGRSDEEEIRSAPIPEPVWRELAAGAAALEWTA